ncbi:single-stranded DNA-binding protein [Bacteroides pyogenes]|uniref:Single-stranded DNA-binding protein n=1 Tax=Bacteroides pyogenes TaxID=310300 RepID=A0A5D3FR62_9BACE|nr:single-stranded DNA-binding protein [Bacteroides pyogenes]MBR8725511.1 Single-stranded DNA-binding protein [Bacteroides pyogenes]MBR8737708.1 Single-stranded DNA-binding protein [Bacteroides pyogenes]MBR8753246.1 Single-stranded DNA-binding protein [Bacteroides pyogenes]MBR8794668.1 Single-stranded DNA-binding protein [Bacteroides pyogenes]MCF2708148.1 single-stranded DNA-binding protein [Bacteroides pyogenes]
MLQCEVIGNIGNDAEIKEFSGKKYVSFNVAHSERRKDANGTTIESTTWVSVLWYGDGGGLIQYLKRGCKVFVRGRLSVKSYQDRSGNMQVAINVNASEVQLCGIKVETNSSQSGATTHEETINDVPF